MNRKNYDDIILKNCTNVRAKHTVINIKGLVQKRVKKYISVALVLSIFLLSQWSHGQKTEKIGLQASTDVQRDSSVLYDHILSDPRNRKHLEYVKQGWIGGIGNNSFLRFGGFVQVNFIRDFQNTGNSYGYFTPSLIPVPTDYTPNLAFDPRSTRITFETQTDTKKGMINSFISIDFSGFTQPGSIQPRLRQAYIAWINVKKRQSLLVGQAGTTFNDGDTWPESFDQEGPNAMLYMRQVMIRYSFMLSKSDHWIGSVALESPLSSIQYGQGMVNLPDLILTVKFKEKWGHLRAGALGRQLIAENYSGTEKAKSFAWGLSFSGQLKVPYKKDNFQFQFAGGQGIGRYIQDLGSASVGQDAVYDSISISLTPLSVYGGFGAYQHWWLDNLRSNVVFGYVNILNQEIQQKEELNQTIYVMVNIIYSPFKRLDVGLEYYYGENTNKFTETGFANRLMLGAKFSL